MKRRILVVDDIPDNRYLLRVLLEGHGYEVSEAEDGVQALASARANLPDAVVTDLLMPKMDGFALCREWGHDAALGRVPVIVYTATYTAPEDRDLVLDLGASAFIVKPVEPEEIVHAIRGAIERTAARTGGGSRLSDEDFQARHSRRLEAKLTHKIDQLAATRRLLEDYVARCEAIFDASPDAIVAVDTSLTIRAWNLSAERLFGYQESEAVGRPIELLIPPDCQDEVRSRFMTVQHNSGRVEYESQHLRKDGTRLDVAISLSYLGPRIGVVAVMSDLTPIRRVAAEKRQLEKKLAIAQRMETVGRLAGGVAHDFNNVLTVVLSHAELIEADPEATDGIRETAQQILEAGEVAASLTRQLLTFGRQQANLPQVLDLNHAIRSMDRILGRLLGENVELVLRLDAELGRVEADPSQVEQVILNLAVNARDAMPNGGRLTIRTTNADVTIGDAPDAAGPMRPGSYVVMTMSDTGAGMDAKTRAQAFDPFFTTKSLGKGTGLGLATVQDIVKRSGGRIWVDSELGQGATFTVFWPRQDRPLSGVRTDRAPSTAAARERTLLVVDDERAVRQVARRMLTRAGYRVLDVSSGEEAEQLAKELAEPIDLLVTDLLSPKLDGRVLAAHLSSTWPSLRVLFTSGSANGLDQDEIRGRSVSLLPKPFTTGELVTAVRAALDDESLDRTQR